MFSSRNVRCNRCGKKMKKIDYDFMVCEECDNEAYLDSEDPENPGHPLQLIAPNGGYDWQTLFGD